MELNGDDMDGNGSYESRKKTKISIIIILASLQIFKTWASEPEEW
jgi:hypothetical protein